MQIRFRNSNNPFVSQNSLENAGIPPLVHEGCGSADEQADGGENAVDSVLLSSSIPLHKT